MTERIELDFSASWDKIEQKFGNLLATAEGDDLFDILAAGGYALLAIAQENAPVDTGFLRVSGQLQRDGDVPVVGFAAEYSAHQEFGTSKMAAQPYLRPAMQETDTIGEAMSKIHKRKIDEASA